MNNMSMRTKLFAAYFIILHILLAVFILKYDLISHTQSIPRIKKNTPESTPHFKRMLTYHKWMDGNVPYGAVIFIGDSITQGLAVSAVFPKSVNYGIGSDTTIGVLERLSSYKSLTRAKAIVIAIGVNDLNQHNNAEIIENFKKILNKLPINIPIIISAILPIDDKIEKRIGGNIRINNLNISITSLCNKYKNVHFLNTKTLLIDSDFNLSDTYHIGDGIHLNTSGYNIWINKLKQALKNQ